MPANRSSRKPQATRLPASRIVNAKIMITDATFSDTAPYRRRKKSARVNSFMRVHRLGQEQAGEQQADGQPDARARRPAQNPTCEVRSVLPTMALRSTAAAMSDDRDQRHAEAAGRPRGSWPVAVDLAGDEDADDDDGEHGETDSGDDHGGSEAGTADPGSWGVRRPVGRVSVVRQVH